MSKKSIRELFEESYNSLKEEDKIDIEASVLAMKFLSLVDAEMASTGMSKKELAKKVGTSASFITQLFMGDRKPSWTMLVKMGKALEINFNILSDEGLEAHVNREVMAYHRKWTKSIRYQTKNENEIEPEVVLSILDDNSYALAG